MADKLINIAPQQAPTPQEVAMMQRDRQEKLQLAQVDLQLRVTCMSQASNIFQGTGQTEKVISFAEEIYTKMTGETWGKANLG